MRLPAPILYAWLPLEKDFIVVKLPFIEANAPNVLWNFKYVYIGGREGWVYLWIFNARKLDPVLLDSVHTPAVPQ